jgi:hypothetical protein
MGRLPEGPETFFRLSPAGQDKAQCFAVRRGEIKKRADAHYHKLEFRLVIKELVSSFPNIKRLDPSYAKVFCGPFGTEITQKDYRDIGVPLLRISNITNKGTIDESNLVFLSEEKARTLASTQVEPGDLVVSQRGTLGIPAVVPSSYTRWNISANLVAIKGLQGLLPRFVQAFLSCRLGSKQLERAQSGQVQGKITTDDVASVLIPNVQDQQRLADDLDNARNARDNKLDQADALLKGIDSFVLREMGLETPKPDVRAVFAVRLCELKKRCEENATRLDPHYNTPNFWRLIREIKEIQSESLGKVACFSDFQWNPGTCNSEFFQYVEIAGIDVLTGDITATTTPVAEAPSRARMLVKTGDILVSLTRPHRGAIGVVPKDLDASVASTGFAVISEIKDKRFSPDYLLAILRTSICLQQMLQRSSGGNYPAITEPELKRITVPLTDENVQKRIVSEIANRKEQVHRIRAEAAALWAKALMVFESKLVAQGAKV